MSAVCTFTTLAAAPSAAASSSRHASPSSAAAPLLNAPRAKSACHGLRLAGSSARRGAAVVMRAEGLDRDDPNLQEKFAVIGSGEHECQGCMYTYVPSKGDDFYPISPGTAFKDLPDDWRCPTCGAEKSKFKNMGKAVAGFEQNQGYGLGTNSMTEGEKSRLIYGALAAFFFLFLSGYLLD